MAISSNVVQIGTTGARKVRRPEHTFQLRVRPWQVQPFLLAPVIPGETLKSALMQVRVVGDPVKSSLLGWWCEHYLFYVKHRDLDGRDDFTAMMLEPAKDLSSYYETASLKYYSDAASIPWAKLCLKRVVEEYFRDEGEAWDVAVVDSLPLAKVSGPGWADDLVADTAYVQPDLNVDLNADTDIMASEVERAMQQWQFMRMNNLTDMSYEDFLRAYGVRAGRVELHRPELLRYSRNWSYPSATVDPATGKANNAVVWSIAERADKDRYFSEPGFIFGVTVTRPKIYFGGQQGAVANYMTTAFNWLPPHLTNDLNVSLKKFAAATGPVGGAAADYWVDLRDLLMYGDQFVNFSLSSTDAGFVALPTSALAKKYASEADAKGLFTFTGEGEGDRFWIAQDGIVMLNVLSPQRDQT